MCVFLIFFYCSTRLTGAWQGPDPKVTRISCVWTCVCMDELPEQESESGKNLFVRRSRRESAAAGRGGGGGITSRCGIHFHVHVHTLGRRGLFVNRLAVSRNSGDLGLRTRPASAPDSFSVCSLHFFFLSLFLFNFFLFRFEGGVGRSPTIMENPSGIAEEVHDVSSPPPRYCRRLIGTVPDIEIPFDSLPVPRQMSITRITFMDRDRGFSIVWRSSIADSIYSNFFIVIFFAKSTLY